MPNLKTEMSWLRHYDLSYFMFLELEENIKYWTTIYVAFLLETVNF